MLKHAMKVYGALGIIFSSYPKSKNIFLLTTRGKKSVDDMVYVHICDSCQILDRKPIWYGTGTCIKYL